MSVVGQVGDAGKEEGGSDLGVLDQDNRITINGGRMKDEDSRVYI